MGAELSSIIDDLSALKHEERQEAAEKWLEHEPLRTYLKSKLDRDSASLKRLCKRKRPLRIQTSSKPLVKLSFESWYKDPSSFWTSGSHTFVPSETSHPVSFIYFATAQFHEKAQEDCLRRRFIALFWFDYFEASFPERKRGTNDCEYTSLARWISGTKDQEEVGRVAKAVAAQVRAGRRYNKLAAAFGDSVLLTLPTSIGPTTLEEKLPLNDEEFTAWSQPLVGSKWLNEAKAVQALGGVIRSFLLGKCLNEKSNNQTQSFKGQTDPQVVPSMSSTRTWSSTNPPTTPLDLPLLYRIEAQVGADVDELYNRETSPEQFTTDKNIDNNLMRQGSRHMLNAMHNEDASPESNREHNLPNADRSLPVSDTGYGYGSNKVANHGHASEETPSILPDQGTLQTDSALASFGQSETEAQETVLSAGVDNLGIRDPMLSSSQLGSPQPTLLGLNSHPDPSSWPPSYAIYEPEDFEPERELYQPEPFESDSMFSQNRNSADRSAS